MSNKTISTAICILLGLITLSSTGCIAGQGINLGLAGIPIPVSPYTQHKKEQEYWIHERYEKVPILPPLTAGGPDEALDAPSDDEVMHALERARPQQGTVPFIYEVHRDNVRITRDRIADYVDPPRVIPLVGPVQLHHAHYKCTVYFSETIRIGWPIPHTLKNEDAVEVLYIDHNHFHQVGNIDPGVASNY